MSAPVDVLVVMDAEISYAEDALARRETLAALTRVRDLREARAVVAELVEAAWDIHENGYGTAANKRLAAALAKFGGAK